MGEETRYGIYESTAFEVQVLHACETGPGSTLEARRRNFPVSAKRQPEPNMSLVFRLVTQIVKCQ